MKKETITLTKEELFNLILNIYLELPKLGATGLVSKAEFITSKIDELYFNK
jgi:hypothetical protein